MKRILLGSSALFSIGLLSTPAIAEEPIKLSVGGYFKEAYMVVIDDDGEGERGNERNTDGFFNDAEIHFTGSTLLDNGLEVGARVELEGETDGDQIDEAWVWFSGGFGEVRIGSEDEALSNACIVPPGGTGNFSAFSPNQWGANDDNGNSAGSVSFFGGLNSNTICTGVDELSDAQKLVYISPNFAGFQLTLSYTPNSIAESHADGAGPHLGMPGQETGTSRHNVSAYLTYSYEGEGWGLTAGGGGSWEGHREDSAVNPQFLPLEEQDFYQAGVNLTFGNFAVGGAFEYFNNSVNLGPFLNSDVWVAGGGISYTMDAWTFGAQYSHHDSDTQVDDVDADVQRDRAVLTAQYALGPGIKIDGEIGYTWVDTDISEPTDLNNVDGYDALEFGIGTNITF
jgi:predicted porin